MREVEIRCLSDYLALIKESKEKHDSQGHTTDFLFRGQSGDYPLLPKLSRLKPRGDILTVEVAMLREFKRTNPLLIEQQMPLNDWDYLTLGQHFGLPTRLLDWSNNALTALWFATAHHSCEQNDADAVVWILMAQEADFDIDMDTTHPFDVPAARIVRPRIIKQRINNQSGVFSVFSSLEIQEKVYLDQIDSYRDKLIRIKIDAGSFADIRNDLNTLGVNAFTIFPELEGLCSFLQWRYFE